MKKSGRAIKKIKKWAPDGRTMGITKISRISPINSKKVQKNAPIGQKCVCFFFFKAENGLMVGAMKSAFFFNGRSEKKRRDLPIFGNRYFGPFFLHSLLGTARTN